MGLLDLDRRDRMLEVWRLVSQGLTNEEIARELYISRPTVKVYVNRLLRTLGVRNRIEAAYLYGVRVGSRGTPTRVE